MTGGIKRKSQKSYQLVSSKVEPPQLADLRHSQQSIDLNLTSHLQTGNNIINTNTDLQLQQNNKSTYRFDEQQEV